MSQYLYLKAVKCVVRARTPGQLVEAKILIEDYKKYVIFYDLKQYKRIIAINRLFNRKLSSLKRGNNANEEKES